MQFSELKCVEIKCAIYCRLSQEDRNKEHEIDDSVSIQNQKSMLISYAEANGWKVYKVYVDDDYTGADRSRPAFNELLQDAESKKFQIVLCKSQSRFTRELELVEKYLHDLFPLWGIRFIGLVDNADTENKGNKKSRQINGLVNEWYLEDLSENIKGVLTDRRKKGFHIGAFAVYGYQKDPEKKGHLIPDPEAAAVVHWIFEMYAGGMGKTSIARKLNEEGVPNPTAYKLLKGIRKNAPKNMRSSLWHYYVITDILANEVYIGHMVQGKYGSVSYKTHQNKPRPKEEWIRVLYTHAPIIEKELWDKVQNIRGERTKPGWNGEVGLFARKTRCMYCGYAMRSKKLADGRKYLRCSTHMMQKTVCVGGFISVKELEETILTELRKMVIEYLDMDAAEEQMILRDEQKEKIATLKKELKNYKNKLAGVDKTIKTLYLDRVQGVITPEEFSMLSDGFKADKRECEKRAEEVQQKIELLQAQKDEELSKREILEQCANIRELNYDIVNTLIEFIEVGKREGHYREYKVPVVIHWRF
ncbi:MAG: recombinase family protein [Lachnospiraceae bacterium]|nr:recombinase family protein [Lachnospiraceae bacterium]